MTHLLKTIAISAVLVAATTTGLVTALSMMDQQTALAAVGTGGGEGTGGGSTGSGSGFTGGLGNGGNIITGSGGGGFGFGNNPSDPIFSHCGFGAGGSIGSGGTHGGGSC
jgi:hypothetical protein